MKKSCAVILLLAVFGMALPAKASVRIERKCSPHRTLVFTLLTSYHCCDENLV